MPSQERPSCSAAVRRQRRPRQSGLGCRERRAHAATPADRIDPAVMTAWASRVTVVVGITPARPELKGYSHPQKGLVSTYSIVDSLTHLADDTVPALTSIAESSGSSANLYSGLAASFFGSFEACCNPPRCKTVRCCNSQPTMSQHNASVHCRRALGVLKSRTAPPLGVPTAHFDEAKKPAALGTEQ